MAVQLRLGQASQKIVRENAHFFKKIKNQTKEKRKKKKQEKYKGEK
jgi:hypothetical protein